MFDLQANTLRSGYQSAAKNKITKVLKHVMLPKMYWAITNHKPFPWRVVSLKLGSYNVAVSPK